MAAPRRPGDTVPAAAPASPPQAAGQVLSPLPQRIYSEDSLADRDPASPGHRLFPAGTPQLPASRAPPPAAASAAAPPRRGSQRSRTPPAELRAAAQRLGATPSEDAASLDRGAVAEDGVCPCRAARSGEAPRPAAGAVALADWEAALDAEGALSPQQWAELRRRVFTFGCADADARKVVWTHLLQVIPVGCSAATRREREERLRREYLHYRQQYRMVTPAQRKHWAAFTEREQQVQRDVLRTDRASPLFSDEHGEGVRQLRDVLMAHQMYNHDLGYCQGMNEVAALLLRVLGDDALAFWGLVCMMEGRLQLHRTFAGDLSGAREQLDMLAGVLRELDPQLARHLAQFDPAFLFAFRWVAVRFKRDLAPHDTLRIWDAWLACPSGHFHILVACALLRQGPLRGRLLRCCTQDEVTAACAGARLRESADAPAAVTAAVGMWEQASGPCEWDS
eukprot:TRINITY_DN26098_c0_g1_i2.p1 TRINITY_DN26098_c0_g1~~TRINITY_DN26098_c0_g1_i2.p1  ORF type:complete len:488 (+),score=115.76 TRINITY_DN26098_c0_g1_i2:112-1464(+)